MTTFMGMLSGMCFTFAAVIGGWFHYPPGLIFIVPAALLGVVSFANAK